MSYTVRDLPVVGNPVDAAISRFETSSAPGAWSHLSKGEIVAGIRERIGDAYKVKQATSPLCGPAAIVFEFIRRQPQRYVGICQELFETGQFLARTQLVQPSATLLQSQGHPKLAPVDWMLMATLRDTENAIFPVESTSGDVVMGLTTPGEMEGWASELLCFDAISYDSTYFAGELDAMEKAAEVRSGGGVAFLLIDAALVNRKAPTIATPNHWVSFLGDLEITGGDERHIKFQCYSWGGHARPVDADEETFEDYMWGLVTVVS